MERQRGFRVSAEPLVPTEMAWKRSYKTWQDWRRRVSRYIISQAGESMGTGWKRFLDADFLLSDPGEIEYILENDAREASWHLWVVHRLHILFFERKGKMDRMLIWEPNNPRRQTMETTVIMSGGQIAKIIQIVRYRDEFMNVTLARNRDGFLTLEAYWPLNDTLIYGELIDNPRIVRHAIENISKLKPAFLADLKARYLWKVS